MDVKKLISVILIFCMIIAMFPFNYYTALAAEDTNMSDMDALTALGIDTSKTPEGYDPNDTSNPYGKDTVTINPVNELYVLGLKNNTSILSSQIPLSTATESSITIDNSISNELLGTLYGHDDFTSKTASDILNKNTKKVIATGSSEASGKYNRLEGTSAGYYLQSEDYDVNTSLSSEYETTDSFSIAASKTINGNFNGNTKGKTSQNVMLYTSKYSEHGGMFMRIGDVDTGEYGRPITLIPANSSYSIGNPSGLVTDVKENFATDPYLMQNYLQLTTGDYDGDGTDEIAVFIPEYGKSRIVVYRLKQTTDPGDKPYRKADQWSIAWTYSLKETNYVSNMVSLVSGDFNEDGIDDLGTSWGYYYGPGHNKGSKAVIMFGSKGSMLQSSQQFDLTYEHPKYGSTNIVRASFTFGDLTGSGEELLILGGQTDADIAHNNLNTRYVAIYTWNGSSFNATLAHNFDLFAKDDDGNLINSAMSINNGNFYSLPLCPANLSVISQGLNEKPYLYLDSLQIQYNDEGLAITAPLDQHGSNNGNKSYYVEYGAISGDLVGLGYDTVATIQQTMPSHDTVGSSIIGSSYYYPNWWYRLFNIKFYVFNYSTNYCSKFTPNKTYMNLMDFGDNFYKKSEVDSSTSICMQNTDEDTSYIRYTGKHYFTYSDPKVLAVLASPPYFSDLLDRDDLSGNYAESTTSYTSSKGSGSGDTFNTTIEAGVYVSYEKTFSILGVEIASIEAEAAVTAGFTYEMEKTSTLEQSVSYSATAGEDMIALFSIPIEIYEYTAYIPNGDGSYSDQVMTVNIPRTAAVQLLTLESYENIAKDYDILPQISGTILTHELGDPKTYSSSANGYLKALSYDGDWARVGYSGSGGGASIAQEISMTYEESDSYTIFGRIDTKAGAGAGGFKVGVTLGAEAGGGWVYTKTSGSTFSGEIQNMPVEAEEYGYSYSWKIFSYLYDDGKVSFPIVDYLVQDVVSPASLPKDFKQNVEKTTDTDIAFTWTYDKMVAGFQIYRYFEFPDGSGSYELMFVPMTDGIYDANDGLYHFEFIDDNLSPYTDYMYQIQTVRASVPNNSIQSEVVIARTKTDVGYPQLSVLGLNEDGLLNIYPDSESTVKAIVGNPSDYPGGISYQWQKNVNGVWTDLTGKTSNRLVFKSSGVADQARYRCRTNVIYFDPSRGNTYYISAYTDEFTTVYSKRTPLIVEDSFQAITYKNNNNGTGVRISIDLISGNTNHYEAPSGYVTFTVKGTDYNVDHTVSLKKSSTAIDGGKFTSKAELDISNLPDGVYEVSAYYSGSRVFKSLSTPEDITFLIGNSGYQLLLQKGQTQSASYIYGDEITPVLKYLENIEGRTVVSDVDTGVTYSFINNKTNVVNYVTETFRSPNVGSYTFDAAISPIGTVAQRDFTVSPKAIYIKAMDKTNVGKGFVELPENKPKLELQPSSAMAFDEKLSDLNLGITSTNTAGNVIVLNNSTEPGNYTIIGNTTESTDATKYNNYDVTYVPGVYTIIGQTYLVTTIAEKYQGRDVGAITLSNAIEGKEPLFSASTELLFFATPYKGYEVESWSVKVSDTGQIVDSSKYKVSDSKTTLSMLMNDEPITVTVKFKKSELTLTTAMEGMGNITCDNAAFISGGIVTAEAEMNFTAHPEIGYTFKEWRIETSGVTTVKSGVQNADGTNTLAFTMGVKDTIIRAIFERDSYTITLSNNLEVHYTYLDDLGNPVERIVYSGAKIVGDTTVLVRVKSGYAANDQIWRVNGEEVTPTVDGYEFVITKDTTITVPTIQLSYDITTISVNGTITVNINGVDSSALEGVAGGSNVVFTAIPAHGFAFDKFIVTGTGKYTQLKNILTIAELGSDVEVTAIYVPSIDYNITVNYGTRADINYILYDAFGNEVRKDKVSSGNSIGVCKGDDITFIVSTNSGYMVDKWTIDGVVYDINSKIYGLENISKDMNVVVDIISQTSYTVNYNVGGGIGTISSATSDGRYFVSGDADVGGNSKVVISSVPGTGYMVDYWTINGVKVENEEKTNFIGKVLTIDSLISSSRTVDISVYFRIQDDHTVTYAETNVNISSEFTPNDAFTAGLVRDGAKAIFTVTPDIGYRIVSFVIDGAPCTIVKNEDSPTDEFGTWTGTVDSVNDDLTITAIAEKIYTITIDTVNGGTLDSSTTTKYSYQAIEGEKVNIYEEAKLDYTFDYWDVSFNREGKIYIVVNGNSKDGFTFDMPNSDVEVSAKFKEIDTVDISYYVFDTNGELENGYNGTISAEISRNGVSEYPKEVADSTTSGAIKSINRGYADEYATWPKSIVTFNANPDSDYKVLKWIIDGVEYTSPLDFPVKSNSINTLNLNIEEDTNDIDIVIQFEQIGEEVTYDVDGRNGNIVSAINEGTNKEFISGNIIASPTTLSFTAEPNNGYEVEAWLVNGNVEQSGKNKLFNYAASPYTGAKITVKFARVPFKVNYSGVNGTVTSDEVVNGGTVRGDSSVTFTSSANPGYKFDSYTIKGATNYTSNNNPLTISISADTTVTANFVPFANCVVNYNSKGNGSLTGAKNATAFVNGEVAAANDVITFTATPDENYNVKSWTVDGNVINSSSTTYSLKVSKAIHNVSVEFERSHYVVNFNSALNGTILAKSGTQAIISGASLLKDSIVSFIATPTSGYQVMCWKVDGVEVENSREKNSFIIDKLNADTSVTVEFELIPEFNVLISTSGTGEGTISAFVNGIDTPIVNGQITVKNHDKVSLIAVPKDEYNNITWTIASIADYEITNNTATIKDVTSDIKATAKFGVAELISVEAYARKILDTDASANGTISVKAGYGEDLQTINAVNTTVNVTKGKTVKFTATPADGYMVKSWKLDEKVIKDLSNNITRVPETNIKAEVDFEPIVAYKIPEGGSNYTVTINIKVPDELPLAYKDLIRKNGSVTFTVKPDEGYYFTQLDIAGLDCLTNSKSDQKITENIVTVAKNNKSYIITVKNVTADIAYTINLDKVPSGGGGGFVPVTAFTITAIAGNGGSITPEFAEVEKGESQKFTIIPDEGYKIADVLVDGKSIGIVTEYIFENVKSNGKIEVLFEKELYKEFTDVHKDDWFYDAVNFVVKKGLFNGASENEFSPYMSMTRGMFATVLGRLYENMNDVKLDSVEGLDFKDVPIHQYYATSVKWASDNNIVKGYVDDLFKPEEKITREQSVAILYRFAQYANIDTSQNSDLTRFKDVKDVSDWAVEAFGWAVGSGLIGGRTDGKLDPQGFVQRCEVAALLQRFVEVYNQTK